MTYIITEPCVGVCDNACVDVCPVDCIYPADGLTLSDEDKEKMISMNEILYIHPEECIDCGACEPECPVEAIFPEDETPEKWQQSHYKVTEHLLDILPKRNVPGEVVSGLESLKDQEFESKDEFSAAVNEAIGSEAVEQYGSLIIVPAYQNFIEKNYQRFDMEPGDI